MARFIWLFLAVGVLVVAAPTTSDAQPAPAPTCQTACQRLVDCHIGNYAKMCFDSCKQFKYEAEAGRKTLLMFTKMSCKQLQQGMASMAAQQGQGPQGQGAQGQQAPQGQGQRPAPRGGSPRNGAPRGGAPQGGNIDADMNDLDQLDRELGDLERQLGSDEQELERRSRARGPAPGRGTGGAPQRGQAPPVRGRTAGGNGGGGRGRVWWMCTAEASLGSAEGNGPMTYRQKSAVNNGPTKEEAAMKALKDCGAIVGAAMAIEGDRRHEGGTCEISQCISGQ